MKTIIVEDLIGGVVESINEHMDSIEIITLKFNDGHKINMFVKTDNRTTFWLMEG